MKRKSQTEEISNLWRATCARGGPVLARVVLLVIAGRIAWHRLRVRWAPREWWLESETIHARPIVWGDGTMVAGDDK